MAWEAHIFIHIWEVTPSITYQKVQVILQYSTTSDAIPYCNMFFTGFHVRVPCRPGKKLLKKPREEGLALVRYQ